MTTTDPVTPLIDRLAQTGAADLPGLFRTLVKERQMGPLMRRINADLLGPDAERRDRAALVLARLGFPD